MKAPTIMLIVLPNIKKLKKKEKLGQSKNEKCKNRAKRIAYKIQCNNVKQYLCRRLCKLEDKLRPPHAL